MSTATRWPGKRELPAQPTAPSGAETTTVRGRPRRPGGGRKSAREKQPQVLPAIERIVDPARRGDPMAPLKWTSKSLSPMGSELRPPGYAISATTVRKLWDRHLGYSLPALPKTREGISHPDRDAQLHYSNRSCPAFPQRGQPVISIASQKKERVGDFQNGGREWPRKGTPEPVRTPDLEDQEKGQVTPQGV